MDASLCLSAVYPWKLLGCWYGRMQHEHTSILLRARLAAVPLKMVSLCCTVAEQRNAADMVGKLLTSGHVACSVHV